MDKKLMNITAEPYVTPLMKVKELRHRSVLCGSLTGSGIDDMTEDDETNI